MGMVRCSDMATMAREYVYVGCSLSVFFMCIFFWVRHSE
jgi:hypothetical protein